MTTWIRLAYARTDPRNRHGAWHAANPARPGRFLDGDKIPDGKQLQQLVQDKQPAGRCCVQCLEKAGFTTAAELAARRRRG